MQREFIKMAGYKAACVRYGLPVNSMEKEAALPAIIPFLAAAGGRIAASRLGQAIGKSWLGKAWNWSNKPFFKPLAKDGILGKTRAGEWAQNSRLGKALGWGNDMLGVGTRGGAAILGATTVGPMLLPKGDTQPRQVAAPTGTTL